MKYHCPRTKEVIGVHVAEDKEVLSNDPVVTDQHIETLLDRVGGRNIHRPVDKIQFKKDIKRLLRSENEKYANSAFRTAGSILAVHKEIHRYAAKLTQALEQADEIGEFSNLWIRSCCDDDDLTLSKIKGDRYAFLNSLVALKLAAEVYCAEISHDKRSCKYNDQHMIERSAQIYAKYFLADGQRIAKKNDGPFARFCIYVLNEIGGRRNITGETVSTAVRRANSRSAIDDGLIGKM